MGFFVYLWREKPHILYLILIGLLATSWLTVVLSKEDGPSSECQHAASAWRHETMDVKIIGSNALEWDRNQREWANAHSQALLVRREFTSTDMARKTDERYDSLWVAGHYASILSDCVESGDYGTDLLVMNGAPLTPPKDEWRDCLLDARPDAYRSRQSQAITVAECEPVLYEAQPWIVSNIPY